MLIRKRDGRLEELSVEKVAAGLERAGRETRELPAGAARRFAAGVVRKFIEPRFPRGAEPPTVEDIQDAMEEALLLSPHRRTAKAYIIHREQQARLREINEAMSVAMVDGYLDRADWRVNENSNMDYSLQGLNNHLSSEVSKTYWLRAVYPPSVRDAHGSGDIHLHDLGLIAPYCVGWDLQDLLLSGFGGVPGKVRSAPAKHLRSALGQVVNFFYTLQGEAAGAQAFSNFDTLLAPFIRYDRLSYQDVKQALQEFVYNINIPTRVGFQTPFTNVTLDLRPPAHLAGQHVVIGGEPRPETYGGFQAEMDLFNRAFFEVMAGGDASGRVFTFPIPTCNITRDFDWGNPALEGLWELTAKYGAPYFSNYVTSGMDPADSRSMCCRLRLDTGELRRRAGGVFAAGALTGSVGVVTVNLPRIGHLARDEAEFLELLRARMETARDSLEIKRRQVELRTAKGLYPYCRFYLRGVKERFGAYWANHFSTIGVIGMHEACLNLLGRGIETPEGRGFALRVLTWMRGVIGEFQRRTGNLYNLEATPAEGASYSLAQKDVRRHPAARFSGTPGSEYYTNSTQLPVGFTDDLFEALEHQEALQGLYTGGTVFHAFLGERIPAGAVPTLVRRVFSRCSIPYLTLTPTFSVCPDHGYIPGERPECPSCGGETEVYSRIVGYLRPVKQWNRGKKMEFRDRRLFTAEVAHE